MSSGAQVELVKKATCTSVEIQDNQQYLVMGSSGSEITLERSLRWVLLLPPLLLLGSPAASCPGIGSLWTRRRWWSCGPQIVVLPSVWTTVPSWTTLLWTCS